jgi:hypothetical protein
MCGPIGEDIVQSINDFPPKLTQLSTRLSKENEGPFPLCHTDFGHNNIIVDDNYNILGFIDWEHATAVPWECQYFPLTLNITPKPMDAPWNYDENGVPKEEKRRNQLVDRRFYVDAVIEAEKELKLDSKLSASLGDDRVQNVSTGMRLYGIDGVVGWYSALLEPFFENSTV